MDGSVIVPLYVYPTIGAWDPVFNMASSYPKVQFNAIVNIHDGPGEGALPNEAYWQALWTLNSFDNVRTIGYVATTWCERNLSSVLDDIAAYSFWGIYHPLLALDGIFVDETPTKYTPDYVSYLQTISQAVHDSPGLKDSFIVHNPGALPEPQYFEDATSEKSANLSADLTVIYENSFLNWSTMSNGLIERTKNYPRKKLALLVHSVPLLTTLETETTLRQLLEIGHTIWLTGTSSYTNFDAVLPVFISCLAALIT